MAIYSVFLSPLHPRPAVPIHHPLHHFSPREPGSRQTKGAPMGHLRRFALFGPSRPTTPTVRKRPRTLLAARAAVPRFPVFRSHCKQSVNMRLRGRNLSIVQDPQLRPALNRRQFPHSAEQMLTAQDAFNTLRRQRIFEMAEHSQVLRSINSFHLLLPCTHCKIIPHPTPHPLPIHPQDHPVNPANPINPDPRGGCRGHPVNPTKSHKSWSAKPATTASLHPPAMLAPPPRRQTLPRVRFPPTDAQHRPPPPPQKRAPIP